MACSKQYPISSEINDLLGVVHMSLNVLVEWLILFCASGSPSLNSKLGSLLRDIPQSLHARDRASGNVVDFHSGGYFRLGSSWTSSACPDVQLFRNHFNFIRHPTIRRPTVCY